MGRSWGRRLSYEGACARLEEHLAQYPQHEPFLADFQRGITIGLLEQEGRNAAREAARTPQDASAETGSIDPSSPSAETP